MQVALHDVEKALVTHLTELLDEPVPVDVDLFDLGLTSTAATRVLAWLSGEFGTKVTVRTLYEEPTVRNLAAAVIERTEEVS